MRGLGTAGRGVDHLLGVAVISGDDHRSPVLLQRLVNLAEAGVHSFDRRDGWRNLPRMSHHVGIGEVHHHHVEALAGDGLHHRVGNSLR